MHRKASTQIDPLTATIPPASGVVPAAEFTVGSVIADKYVVEHTIGDGALGVVLKAHHLRLDQPVVIKYVKPIAAAQPDVVERFLREARLAASIKNEHAVKVYDVHASPGGVPYLVMEYLEGRDLDRIVAESPLPVGVAIDYLMQAIEAIAEAHGAGIVHRDLKPANLFLAARPGGASIVKVLDFGISKRISGDSSSNKRVTHVDERLGTPLFMSPEQLTSSSNVDARSDVWSLGVTLYELVTGEVPFDGADLPQVYTSILTKRPVALSAVHADAPIELERIIERCLQKDPVDRYQNVAELAQDLSRIWQGESTSRVHHIAALVAEGVQDVAPPEVRTIDVLSSPALLEEEPVVVDHVVAVFLDASGTKVDELEFLSTEEAYDYASTLGNDVVRCDLYDHFAGVRGNLRATYVRKPQTGQWVTLVSCPPPAQTKSTPE